MSYHQYIQRIQGITTGVHLELASIFRCCKDVALGEIMYCICCTCWTLRVMTGGGDNQITMDDICTLQYRLFFFSEPIRAANTIQYNLGANWNLRKLFERLRLSKLFGEFMRQMAFFSIHYSRAGLTYGEAVRQMAEKGYIAAEAFFFYIHKLYNIIVMKLRDMSFHRLSMNGMYRNTFLRLLGMMLTHR